MATSKNQYRILKRTLEWGAEYVLEKRYSVTIAKETETFWVEVRVAPSRIELATYLESLKKAAIEIVGEEVVAES